MSGPTVAFRVYRNSEALVAVVIAAAPSCEQSPAIVRRLVEFFNQTKEGNVRIEVIRSHGAESRVMFAPRDISAVLHQQAVSADIARAFEEIQEFGRQQLVDVEWLSHAPPIFCLALDLDAARKMFNADKVPFR